VVLGPSAAATERIVILQCILGIMDPPRIIAGSYSLLLAIVAIPPKA
jgi:hypothetical protein